MKLIIVTFLLISNLALFAQSNHMSGDYNLVLAKEGDHLLDYKLTLNQDGTFYFHYYSNIKQANPVEVNKYGKGKWVERNNLVTFFSDKKQDIDEKYTLDFNNSKARFISKSPRDKTDRIVKKSLNFIESEIFWMKGIRVLKI